MKRLTATAGTKSKLAKPVQELIKMIFDVESMKKAMVEFEVKENLGFAADVPLWLYWALMTSLLLFRLTSRRCHWGS